MLGVSRNQLNLFIFRGRKQLAEAGVRDARILVERRLDSGQLRLGVDRITVSTVGAGVDMNVQGVNHITLAVRELDRAWTFWVDVLGCRPLMRSPRSAYLLAGELWLCLVVDPTRTDPPLSDYTHLALDVSAEAFEGLRQRVLDSGARPFQDNVTEGQSMYVLDPDGHKVELHVGDWRSRIEALKALGRDDIALFV